MGSLPVAFVEEKAIQHKETEMSLVGASVRPIASADGVFKTQSSRSTAKAPWMLSAPRREPLLRFTTYHACYFSLPANKKIALAIIASDRLCTQTGSADSISSLASGIGVENAASSSTSLRPSRSGQVKSGARQRTRSLPD